MPAAGAAVGSGGRGVFSTWISGGARDPSLGEVATDEQPSPQLPTLGLFLGWGFGFRV